MMLQFQLVPAVGIPKTPPVAVPPVPTFTRKAVAVPEITGDVPNPELTVGAVPEKVSVVGKLIVETLGPADQTGATPAPCEINTCPLATAARAAKVVPLEA